MNLVTLLTDSPMPTTFRAGPLASTFLRSLVSYPVRPALLVEGAELSYTELADRAFALAATLEREQPSSELPHTAVLAARSPTAFAGVLAALLRGHAYIPLNPRFPGERTRDMLVRSGASAVVVDGGSTHLLDDVLEGVERPLVLVLADSCDVSALRARWPRHRVLGAGDVAGDPAWEPRAAPVDATAYLMFTSGSTGRPKGVQVLQRNVRHFLDVARSRWAVTPEDRLSQTFDLTFDLSVHDMFVAWDAGACVCCPSAREVLKPAAFVREAGLTVWYSVPSLGLLMKRLGMLAPSAFPGLRLSLFCGEALPVELAQAWAAAAPRSVVENVYGPTEATISTTFYRWEGGRSEAEAELGLVPIGEPHPAMEALVVDEELREVGPGDDGELLLAGPQVVAGYWRDPEKTARVFVRVPGREGVHYRTGDRVRRPSFPGDPLRYLGRVDLQVKVSGYRVELGEVEAALREATGVDEVVAVGWPRTPSGYGGVAAFVRGESVDAGAVRTALARRLPDYMLPRTIRAIAEIPLNANGKFDRPALTALLDESA
jgi:amino acid adenylation domain-containing protein